MRGGWGRAGKWSQAVPLCRSSEAMCHISRRPGPHCQQMLDKHRQGRRDIINMYFFFFCLCCPNMPVLFLSSLKASAVQTIMKKRPSSKESQQLSSTSSLCFCPSPSLSSMPVFSPSSSWHVVATQWWSLTELDCREATRSRQTRGIFTG